MALSRRSVIGGRFYCLSDVHKNSDFKLQSINRQGIAVFYTSIPDKVCINYSVMMEGKSYMTGS